VIGFRKGQEFFPSGKRVDRTTQPRVQLVPRVLFSGLKPLGHECDFSLQCITEVKQACSSTPLFHTASWCAYLLSTWSTWTLALAC